MPLKRQFATSTHALARTSNPLRYRARAFYSAGARPRRSLPLISQHSVTQGWLTTRSIGHTGFLLGYGAVCGFYCGVTGGFLAPRIEVRISALTMPPVNIPRTSMPSTQRASGSVSDAVRKVVDRMGSTEGLFGLRGGVSEHACWFATVTGCAAGLGATKSHERRAPLIGRWVFEPVVRRIFLEWLGYCRQ